MCVYVCVSACASPSEIRDRFHDLKCAHGLQYDYEQWFYGSNSLATATQSTTSSATALTPLKVDFEGLYLCVTVERYDPVTDRAGEDVDAIERIGVRGDLEILGERYRIVGVAGRVCFSLSRRSSINHAGSIS